MNLGLSAINVLSSSIVFIFYIMLYYQKYALEQILENSDKKTSSLLFGPPNSGMNDILFQFVRGFSKRLKPKPTLIVAHNKRMAHTIQKEAEEKCNQPVFIITSSDFGEYDDKIKICLIQNLKKHLPHFSEWRPEIVVLNCSHHYRAEEWESVLQDMLDILDANNCHPVFLGSSSSVERGDSRGLSKFFDEIVYLPSIAQLINMGVSSDFSTHVINAGEMKDSDNLKNNEIAPQSVINIYENYYKNQQILFFGHNISHSNDVAALFQSRGVNAVHIDSSLTEIQIKSAVDDFNAGKIKILCNCKIVDEGFYSINPQCIIDCGKTNSLRSYMERVSTLLNQKNENRKIIVDLASNYERFPDIKLLSMRTLHLNEETYNLNSTTRNCPNCHHNSTWFDNKCHECGYTWVRGIGENSNIHDDINNLMVIGHHIIDPAEHAFDKQGKMRDADTRNANIFSTAIHMEIKKRGYIALEKMENFAEICHFSYSVINKIKWMTENRGYKFENNNLSKSS